MVYEHKRIIFKDGRRIPDIYYDRIELVTYGVRTFISMYADSSRNLKYTSVSILATGSPKKYCESTSEREED